MRLKRYRGEKNSYLFFGLLFSQPLMKIHFVDLIKTLLVKDAVFPEFVKMAIKTLGIVITDKLLNVIQFLIAFNMRKHPQQIKLCRVENGRLPVFPYGIVFFLVVNDNIRHHCQLNSITVVGRRIVIHHWQQFLNPCQCKFILLFRNLCHICTSYIRSQEARHDVTFLFIR